MKYILNKYVLGMLTSILLLTSCDKNEDPLATVTTQQDEVGYVVRDGYLVFDSYKSFASSVNKIVKLSEIEKALWEKSIGFKSQQTVITNIVYDELKLDSLNRIKYANTILSPTKNSDFNSESYIKALNSVTKQDLHPASYYNALELGIIETIDKGTENEYWDYSIKNSIYGDFINEEGFYGIADSLYLVTKNGIKSIKYVNSGSKEILKNYACDKQGNSLMKISKLCKSPGLRSKWTQEPTGPWYPKRIGLEFELTMIYFFPSDAHYEVYHRLHVLSQERNIFRKWIYDNPMVDISVNGSWEITVYKHPQLYSGTYSYQGKSNLLYGNIGMTSGVGFSPDGYCGIYPTPQNLLEEQNMPIQYYYQPEFTRVSWSATRTDKKLTASLDYNDFY